MREENLLEIQRRCLLTKRSSCGVILNPFHGVSCWRRELVKGAVADLEEIAVHALSGRLSSSFNFDPSTVLYFSVR